MSKSLSLVLRNLCLAICVMTAGWHQSWWRQDTRFKDSYVCVRLCKHTVFLSAGVWSCVLWLAEASVAFGFPDLADVRAAILSCCQFSNTATRWRFRGYHLRCKAVHWCGASKGALHRIWDGRDERNRKTVCVFLCLRAQSILASGQRLMQPSHPSSSESSSQTAVLQPSTHRRFSHLLSQYTRIFLLQY